MFGLIRNTICFFLNVTYHFISLFDNMCESVPAKHEMPKYHFGYLFHWKTWNPFSWSWLPLLGLTSLIGLYIAYRMSHFGEKSTIGAMKTAESVSKNIDLSGRVCIVTGASDGLGKESSKVLLKQGATIIMCVRDRVKGDEARREIFDYLINKKYQEKETLEKRCIMLSLDLSSLQSVRDFAINFNKLNLPLHYLVNNGGIMALPEYTLSKDGIELQFQVNYLSHFYLTRLLTENLMQTSNSRIINVTSVAMDYAPKPFSEWINKHYHLRAPPLKEEYSSQGFTEYAISKACLLLFAREYQNRYPNIRCISVHPGSVDTKLWDNNKWFNRFHYSLLKILKFLPFEFKTVQQGAATMMWGIVNNEDQIKGGEYYRDCYPSQDTLRVDLRPNISSDDVKEIKLWELSEQLIKKSGFDFTL